MSLEMKLQCNTALYFEEAMAAEDLVIVYSNIV